MKNIHSKDERLLIVCNNSEEVQAVHTMLSENEIACKSVTIIPSVQSEYRLVSDFIKFSVELKLNTMICVFRPDRESLLHVHRTILEQ